MLLYGKIVVMIQIALLKATHWQGKEFQETSESRVAAKFDLMPGSCSNKQNYTNRKNEWL